ncbi:hypothetical protein [Treponema pedis]|uniref:hypothetical protein n=1 Tax=Treponema pedis TaxID=409322 RepID=UPI0004013FC9|nr:hypothetical protein [Treponema pedis]
MKKYFIIIYLFFVLICIFAQIPKTDAEIKNYLVKNGFACFTFNADGTYSYVQDLVSNSVVGKGTYSVQNGIINFETLTDNYYTPQYGKYFSELLELPGKYKLDLESATIYSQGVLININNSKMKLWSEKVPKAYTKLIYNGIECIRYPWYHDSEDGETKCEYIVLLENLKLRQYPSIDAPLVYVNGIDEYCGYSYNKRSIELAGNYCVIRAKTVATSTIDGITAPWYLIIVYGNDESGMDTEEAWIFGGYVKEFKEAQIPEIKIRYRSVLEHSILKAGGNLKSENQF